MSFYRDIIDNARLTFRLRPGQIADRFRPSLRLTLPVVTVWQVLQHSSVRQDMAIHSTNFGRIAAGVPQIYHAVRWQFRVLAFYFRLRHRSKFCVAVVFRQAYF